MHKSRTFLITNEFQLTTFLSVITLKEVSV